MKKFILNLGWVVCLAFILINCSGGSSIKDPVEYNNKIITVLNNLQKDQTSMNTAMTSGDYAKAETVRKDWEKNLNQSIEEVSKIGDFKGDSSFKDAVVETLNQYKGIVSTEYKELIEIRKNNGSEEKEEALLDKINETFSSLMDKVNDASSKFEEQVNK